VARTPCAEDFAGPGAFRAASPRPSSATGDRLEMLGRYGSLRRPAALERERLGERFGAGLDPCGAVEVEIALGPGETRTVAFFLGAGRDRAAVAALLDRYREPASVRAEIDRVHTFWATTLGAIQVRTPDDSFDVLMNGWLPYQALASRLWARCGYDQP